MKKKMKMQIYLTDSASMNTQETIPSVLKRAMLRQLDQQDSQVNASSFASDPAEDEADIARYERERFDSVVSDLMTRYRSRRQHAHTQIHSHSLNAHAGSTGTQGQGGGSLRGKQKAMATGTARARQMQGQGEDGDAAESQAQGEKEELMSHLMAKLRSEVARAGGGGLDVRRGFDEY